MTSSAWGIVFAIIKSILLTTSNTHTNVHSAYANMHFKIRTTHTCTHVHTHEHTHTLCCCRPIKSNLFHAALPSSLGSSSQHLTMFVAVTSDRCKCSKWLNTFQEMLACLITHHTVCVCECGLSHCEQGPMLSE